MSPLSKLLRAAVMLALAFGPRLAEAQKALVYCPVDLDATGCATIKTALTSAYPGGVETGYDGTQGTVDLKTVDLFQYSVVVVPSLADDSTSPYGLLRDATVASKLKAALLGRRAFWSGTPDQGVVSTTRPQKDALIQNLAAWAGGDFATVNAPGLVVLQDNSTDLTKRYDWVQAIAGFTLVADTKLASYGAVSSLTAAGNAVLSSNGSTLAYANMASMGFQTPSGAPGTSLDAVGKTGTGVGGQVVLITQSGANTGGAVVTTDKDDYQPGTTVVITGTGFGAGETVTLTLHEDPTIEQDFSFTATADQNGKFVFSGFSPDSLDVDVRFVLTALGQTTGRRAQTTFTDAAGDVNVNMATSGTFSLTWSLYNNTTCSNSPASSGSATVGTSGNNRFTQAVAAGQSIKLQAGTASTGGTFSSWTFSGGQPASSNNPVCVPHDNNNLNILANYQTTAATSLSVNTASGQFGGTTSLSATLTSGATGVSNKAIRFTLNGNAVCGTSPLPACPMTNSNGQATLANVSLSGINVGTYATAISAAFAGDASFAASNNTGSLQVTQLSQTIAGFSLSALNKVYGDAPFSIASGVIGGGSGNPVTFASLTTSTCTIAADGQVTIVAAGQCTATADQAGNTNYGAAPQVTQSFTIGQASSTVQITWANSIYNGTANAATAVVKNGLGGVVSGATVSLAYYSGSTATGTALAGAPTAAGTYTVLANYAGSAGTYAASSQTATITIAKATASVTPDALSKIYGAADPTLTGTLTGFIAGDAITASYTRAAGETVAGGPYSISATLSPANALSNYDITYNTANFTITKATASVAPNAASKTYGAADPTFTGTLSGFATADNVTATYSRTAGETVGGGPYTISATLAPAGVLTNYNITYNTAAFTIDKANASVTPAAASKTYGTADPALSGTLSGFLAADGVTATYARTTGETVAGSPYSISATLAPAGVLGNYNITYNTAAFTINKALASVTPAAASKIYGESDPALTGSLSGFIAADNVTATYARVTGETVAGGPYKISATLAPTGVLGNYDITYNTADFTINKKTASVAPNLASKTYGDPDPALTGILTGFLTADGVTASYTRTAGETVLGGPYTISATLAPAGVLGNYDITYNTANFTIDKAPLTITAADKSRLYGDANPALTGTIVGIKNGDAITADYTTTAVPQSPVGTYAIVPAAVDCTPTKLANYDVTLKNGTLTVNKAPLTIAAASLSRTYGEANPVLTGTITGIKNGDGITASYSTAATTASVVGPYDIIAAAVDATPAKLGNYDVTLTKGVLTVTQRTLTITANNLSKTYGQTLTFAGTEFTTGGGELVNGDIVSTVTLTSAGAAAAAGVVGSPYAIVPSNASGAGLTNYAIGYASGSLTVNQAVIVAPALSNLVVPYNGAPQQPTVTTTPTGVQVSALLSQDGVPKGSSASAVGVYKVDVTITDPNYTGPNSTGYFVIYDPNGGFVTGGGWINSPVGACKLTTCTEQTTGKANFGFVSKYQNGANKTITATGNTEFQFQAANLNFKATVYEWLTVSGARAQFKGSGTINGSGNYQFMLTSIDGSLPGGNGQDRFRIKIIDASGAVVYDNQMLTTDDAGLTAPGTLIAGGSINIHK